MITRLIKSPLPPVHLLVWLDCTDCVLRYCVATRTPGHTLVLWERNVHPRSGTFGPIALFLRYPPFLVLLCLRDSLSSPPPLAFSPPPFFPASPVCSFALCVSLRSWLRCPDWAASLCPLPSLPCSYAPMVAPWSGTTQSYTPGVVDTGHAGDVARRQAVAILRN